MSPLFTLNHGKLLFSTYAKDKTFVFTSYNADKLSAIQDLINKHYNEERVWMQQITSVKMFAENHIQIDLTENNYCDLQEASPLEMTYFQTVDQHDQWFIYQLKTLMNTHLFVIEEFEHKPEIPLLSIQGFFVEYTPNQHEDIEIDQVGYLNAMLEIDSEHE